MKTHLKYDVIFEIYSSSLVFKFISHDSVRFFSAKLLFRSIWQMEAFWSCFCHNLPCNILISDIFSRKKPFIFDSSLKQALSATEYINLSGLHNIFLISHSLMLLVKVPRPEQANYSFLPNGPLSFSPSHVHVHPLGLLPKVASILLSFICPSETPHPCPSTYSRPTRLFIYPPESRWLSFRCCFMKRLRLRMVRDKNKVQQEAAIVSGK